MQADFIFDVLALTDALSHNRVDPFKKDGDIDNIQWLLNKENSKPGILKPGAPAPGGASAP